MSQHRRVLICGGGITGLITALSIKNISKQKGLGLEPIIFESEPSPYTEIGCPYLLTKWCIGLLLELGLGSILNHISSPIWNLKSFDMDSNQLIFKLPVDESREYFPLYAIRHCDLTRLIILALLDKIEVSDSTELFTIPANNNDYNSLGGTGSLKTTPHLAKGFDESTEHFIKLGHKLESFIIHSNTGHITATFTNRYIESGMMLIGADGTQSTVRDLLTCGHALLDPSTSLSFNGITRLFLPPPDLVTELEDGTLIQDMSRDDLLHFIPDGRSISYNGKKSSFTVSNLGNGFLGWNVVFSQFENSILEPFIFEKKRNLLSKAISDDPKFSIIQSVIQNPQADQNKDNQPHAIQIETRSTDIADSPIFSPISPKITDPIDLFTIQTQTLNQIEMRTLILRHSNGFPAAAQAILARMDVSSVNMNHMHNLPPVESFTSTKYHPGRIMLLGSAAHSISHTTIEPSLTTCLGISEAINLSKLIAKHMDGHNDSRSLLLISQDFDKRIESLKPLLNQAKWEGGFIENSMFRSIWNKSYQFSSSYTLLDMIVRFEPVSKGLESIYVGRVEE